MHLYEQGGIDDIPSCIPYDACYLLSAFLYGSDTRQRLFNTLVDAYLRHPVVDIREPCSWILSVISKVRQLF